MWNKWFAIVWGLGLICVAGTRPVEAWQRAPRYVAVFQDGSRQEGQAFVDWQNTEGQPKLESRPLFDAANPARWLRDRAVTLRPPTGPYVEMFSGDRLPGELLAYRRGDESPYDVVPPHFEVRPTCDLRPPTPSDRGAIRVVAQYVRKIVWQPRLPDLFQPNTVVLRDGGRIAFRAIRLTEAGISVLVDDAFRRVPYGNIAELHLGHESWWTNHFDELAALAPDSSTQPDRASRLVQIATQDGLLATSSLARFAAIPQGNANEPHRWLHGWQPAWSLSVLWVPVANVGTWRFYATSELPLSRVAPTRTSHVPLLGTVTPIVRDANIARGPLRTGGLDFSWGFGAPSGSRLEFPLHPAVRAFRSRFGIDDLAEGGGCVRFRVFHPAPNEGPRFDSQPVVGGQSPGDTGAISLPWRESGGATLTLDVDPAHRDRPANADPFDIRDFADWCDPILELDPEKVRSELEARKFQGIPAWQGWVAYGEPGTETRRGLLRDEVAQGPREFLPVVTAANGPMVLHQLRRLAAEDRWLVLTPTRPQNVNPPLKFEVRVGDEVLGEFEPPLFNRDQRDPAPILVPLDKLADTTSQANISIRLLPHPQNLPWRWRGIRFTDQPPTLHSILDEPASAPVSTGGQVDVVSDERYLGRKSLAVPASAEVNLSLDEVARIRERPTLGEFRYLRIAFRKTGEGRVAWEMTPANPEEPTLLYDAGVGPPFQPDAKRIWTATLGKDWVVITRDLFADGGARDLRAVKLFVPDGERAWFDAICLARTPADLDQLVSPTGPQLNEQQQAELAKAIGERLSKSLVSLEFPGGIQGRGIVVGAEGEIVTTGHLVLAPNRDVTIRTADGRTLKGQTRGVFRTANLGLVRATEGGPWVPQPLAADRTPNPKAPYFAAGLGAMLDTSDVHYQLLRRAQGDEFWSEERSAGWTVGAAWFNASQQVIGLCQGPSLLGGLRWRNLATLPEHLPRLKNGEVWGEWPPFVSPDAGWTLTMTESGCELAQVAPDSPAAKAGLQAGDRLSQADGQPVPTIDRLERVLGAKDPGATLAIDYRRGANAARANVVLGPARIRPSSQSNVAPGGDPR